MLLWSGEEASAEHATGHCKPAPADVAFPSDFPNLRDHEWGYPIGGWGGVAKGLLSRHHPVIFVHGNTRDAADWDEPARSVKQRFLDAGYSMQELWALSYNGKSTKSLPLAFRCRTTNGANVSDLADFVKAVLAYTGAPKADVIAHSLGVTIVRRMLADYPELAEVIEDFVAIAGPNHGTTVCRRAWLFWLIGWKNFVGCDELAPGSAWLASLNGPHGENEARGPTRYLTIYEGTGVDSFYLPWLFLLPVMDQDSPTLKGADNRKLSGLTHNELRTHQDSVDLYLNFVRSPKTP